jgi:iron complex transport system substrate-binding protein
VRSRRAFIAGAAALALAPSLGRSQATRTVTDDTGRRAEVPAKVARVYAAGPPASMLVFALAPEKVLGWTSPFRPSSKTRKGFPKYARPGGAIPPGRFCFES